MNKKIISLATTMALGLVAAGASAATTDQANVTRATLDNGLRVVIVRDTLAPVVTTEMNYLAGADEVPHGFPGTAHAVEHMMFRGSPGLSKDQLLAIGDNLGGDFNADTQEGTTQFYFTLPAQDLNVALRIHAIRMRGVDMTQKGWNKERGAIEQEVSRDMSNPGYKFLTQMQQRMFSSTPYAHTGLGTRPSFDKTSAAALKKFHDTWYAPNNAVLVIAGDVDPQTTLKEVKSLFGAIPRKNLPKRPAFHFQPVKAHTIKLPTDRPYGLVAEAYRMPGLRDKDYATALVLQRAMASKRGKLFDMALTGKALGGSFSAKFMPHAGFGFAIGAFRRGGDSQGVLKTVQGIMADAAAHGIPADQIQAAKSKAIADLDYKKNSITGLANAWSQALANADAKSPDDIKKSIAAVTPAEVNALAKKIFNPVHAITAVLTPQSSGKPTSSKGFGGAESFGGKPSGAVTLPDWATKAFAKLEMPKSAIHPTSFKLKNGLRVIVQPESVSKTVEVYGRIKTNQDLQAARGHEGVANVLNDMFNFGSSNMNRMQFQQALDKISAHESGGSSFSLAVPSKNFAQGMQLLADNELHPAMPQRAFMVMQHRQAGAADGQIQSPAFLNSMHLNKALLPSGDPGLRYATPKSIGSLSLGNVQAYYKKAFRPDMTTIVMVGDVTPAQARKVAQQTFGGWKASGAKPDTDYPKVPLNAKSAQFNTPDSSAKQDSVTMSQLLNLNQNSPQRYALTLGNEVLSGGVMSSRLMNDLRVKHGLVYHVGSNINLQKYRGRFNVSFGCDADKVAPARDMVIRDIRQMQTQPVSADELHKAKGMVLRQLPLSESSFGSIAGQLLQFSLEGKPLNSNTIAAKHYLQLTAAQVQKAFKTYLRPNAFVTAVKGPAPKG